MKQINVPVEDSVYVAAKIETNRCGMLFRKWIERAVWEACGHQKAIPGPVERAGTPQKAVQAGVSEKRIARNFDFGA